MKEQIANHKQKSRHCGLDPQSPAKNTSPNPSKGGKQFLPFGEVRGISGLLRSARNDAPFVKINISHNLTDMLNKITENNIHHSIETGMPIGNEI